MPTVSFTQQVAQLWTDGGFLMIPLALQCLAIYYVVFDLYFDLRSKDFLHTDENRWGHWIDQPADATGEMADIVRYTQDGVGSLTEIRERFAEVKASCLPALDRRLRWVVMIISTAPLTGLLGTVTGMLATFAGISGGGGGKDTVDLVAGGISEALITTQTGLVIAIPGYVVVSRVRRLRDRLELFLRRAENLTLKRFARLLPEGDSPGESSPDRPPGPSSHPAAPIPDSFGGMAPATS